MVTMNDIAARAGVSQTTVSFVINGRTEGVKVSPETRQRVLEVAREMGYRPNQMARAMVTGRNRVIGILTTNSGAESTAHTLAGALEEAAKCGYTTKVFPMPFHRGDDLSKAVETFMTWPLAGALAINLSDDCIECLLKEVKKEDAPVVFVDVIPTKDKKALGVKCNDETGMREALQHLKDLGHQRIGLLSADSSLATSREELFLKLCKELKIVQPPQNIVRGHWWHIDLIEEAALQLLNLQPALTAALCVGDSLAMVLMRIARQQGRSVPEEFSVVGFANLEMAAFADPPLTTIAQQFHAKGQLAVHRLLQCVGEETTLLDDQTAQKQLLPTHLIVRSSTGPAP